MGEKKAAPMGSPFFIGWEAMAYFITLTALVVPSV